MKSSYVIISILLLNLNLFACKDINLDNLQNIEHINLENCNEQNQGDIVLSEVNIKISSIQITFNDLLVIMSQSNDNIGDKIKELNARVNHLKKTIKTSENLYNKKDKVVDEAVGIEEKGKELTRQLIDSENSLKDIQNKMLEVLCQVRGLYITFEMKKEESTDTNTKQMISNVLIDLNMKCQETYDLLKNVDTFLGGFKKLKKQIKENNDYVFAVASSVITLVSRNDKCNSDSCIYTSDISLNSTIKLINVYNENADLLSNININYANPNTKGESKDER